MYAVTPFVGTGKARSSGKWLPGVDVGCLFEYGFAHRIFTGISYGTIRERHEESASSTQYSHMGRWMDVGAVFHVGYKGILPLGIFWIAAANMGMIDYSMDTNRNRTGELWLSLGLGYKY
jgi:hypothetical protein